MVFIMAIFIMLDNPDTEPLEALRKSKEMMIGHKMEFFVLQLSFIGWVLLSILTLGVGTLWLMPYMEVTNAKYYDKLKQAKGN